jgi:hypothetical protein
MPSCSGARVEGRTADLKGGGLRYTRYEPGFLTCVFVRRKGFGWLEKEYPHADCSIKARVSEKAA